ncbi:MAG: hypothetical protein Q8J62_07120 [Candidatus Cloacimonadaceae bacterium]|nr:hypothetical protein [Candidatus Cloacimonadaceae bacterium]
MLAEQGECLNAAVSRLYYTCLLLAKRCAYELGWLTDQDFTDYKTNTHDLIEEGYIQRQLGDPNLTYENTVKLRYLKTLKPHRVAADYSHNKDFSSPMLKEDFDSCKNMAKQFIEAIQNIHNLNII